MVGYNRSMLCIFHCILFGNILGRLPGQDSSRIGGLELLAEASEVNLHDVDRLRSKSPRQGTTHYCSPVSIGSSRTPVEDVPTMVEVRSVSKRKDPSNVHVDHAIKPQDASPQIPFFIRPESLNKFYRWIKPIDLQRYRSPMAFDFLDSLQESSAGGDGPSYVPTHPPLAISELLRMPSVPLWLDLSQQSTDFDQILETELFYSARADHRKSFCPILCYVTVQLSRCMAAQYARFWRKLDKDFTNLKITSTFNPFIQYQIFLPFIYRFLLLKPTPRHWLNIEKLWIKFFIHWKLQLVYLSSIANKSFHPRKEEVLEKAAKSMMWISEVLEGLYVPNFLSRLRDEKKTHREQVKASKRRQKEGYECSSPMGKLFEYILLHDDYDKKIDNRLIGKGMGELLKHWQTDCHAGYPLKNASRMFKKRKANIANQGQTSEGISDKIGCTWNTWSSTCLAIRDQSEKFMKAISGPSPLGQLEKMRSFLYKGEIKSLDVNRETLSLLYQFQHLQLHTEKSKLILFQEFWELIPNLNIKSQEKTYGVKVFDFFLNYTKDSLKHQPLPVKIDIFFKIDEYFKYEHSFWRYYFEKVDQCQRVKQCAKKSKLKKQSVE